MVSALKPGRPQGLERRRSLSKQVLLPAGPTTSQGQAAVEATYKQLLNRNPLAAERLSDAESQLRDGQLTIAGFLAQLAGSELFQQRLNRMPPLRAAAAAYLALLGRAAQPQETSRFLATRVSRGLQQAINDVLSSRYGQDTLPYIRGMATSDGVPLSTVNHTANLYQGNAGLSPQPRDSI